MKTIIFPGYSPHNKDWVMEMAEKLELDHEIRPILWEHWSQPKSSFNANKKAQGALELIGDDKVNIIAKSIGISVALLLMSQIPNQLNKVILCGLPLGGARGRQEEFKKALANFPTQNLIVFQNEHDPLGNFADVKEFFGSINPKIKVVSKPRSDHTYPFFEEFNEFLKA